MIDVNDVLRFLDEIAPLRQHISGDNIGLLVGRADAAVTKVLVALDITPEVIEEAYSWGAQLIVAHHPVIYDRIGGVTDGDYTGARVLALAESHIAAICVHTNLDIADDGVNDALAARLGLQNVSKIVDPSISAAENLAVCRIGDTETVMEPMAFAEKVAGLLGGNGVKLISAGKPVQRVAVGGGACGSDLALAAAAGCDTFVTSDLKHSHMLEAQWLGVNLVDAGHFPTEDIICPVLVRRLSQRFPEIEIKKSAVMTDLPVYIPNTQAK